MLNMIKRVIKKILYGHKSDSESYIKYLRKNGCKIGENVYFYDPKSTSIDVVRMDWISIGNYTKITRGVTILAHDYSPSVLVHTHKSTLLGGGIYTVIGNNCFIGVNSIIMPGCKIGNNCIIGAGSVVTHNMPDNSVCAGNPARVIMTVDQFYEKRERNYLSDAKRNVQHFWRSHGRYPKEGAGELHGFDLLYMPRSQDNWDNYFSTYLAHDNDINDVRDAFFQTEPVFKSYKEFIDFCDENGVGKR